MSRLDSMRKPRSLPSAWEQGRGAAGWIAAAVLLLWPGWLALVGELPGAGIILLASEAAGLFILLRSIAGPRHREAVQFIFAMALWVYTAETLVVHLFPQWSDVFPDSTRYDLNARALVLHWRGQPVPAVDFYLTGLQRLGVAQWLPGDAHPYAHVLGTSRYAYQLWVAGIYALTDGSRATAVFGNLPFLAGTAAGTYLLAHSLFGRLRVAWLAAGLVILDMNFAVWGSVLLRDAIIVFLIVLAFLGSIRLLRGQGKPWTNVLLALCAAGLLALVRFNAVAAWLMGWFGAALAGRRVASRRRGLFAVAALSALVFGLVETFPGLGLWWETSLPGRVLQENFQIFQKSRLMVEAVTGAAGTQSHEKIDVVRQEWHTNLREQPLWVNGARAIARSFMGPFPWVALTHGISGTNFYELMYPGMTLWLLFLPAFLYALWRLPVRGDPAMVLCLVWLGSVAAFYIMGYGQLDGRSRMMAQPLLWIFAAKGAILMASRRPEPSAQSRVIRSE